MSRLIPGLIVLIIANGLHAQNAPAPEDLPDDSTSGAAAPAVSTAIITPVRQEGFQWKSAILEAFTATSIAHLVRSTTEDDTESELGGPWLSNYFHSLENTHGFNDGDAFYTTYALHPMEGSLAGFIEVQNDPAYRDVEFGNSERYWISRMRALAFAAAYSTQWTLGPVSEASIGNVQHYSQPGLDDVIVTPTLGLAWMVGEDAMDRYVIRWIEARVHNPVILLLARTTLNPTRSYANLLRLKAPWYRDNRGGIGILPHHEENAGLSLHALAPATRTASAEPHFDAEAWPKSVAFELEADPVYERFLGASGSNCVGGEGRTAIKISGSWAAVANVGGCELMGFSIASESGDTLWYLAGTRYSHGVSGDPRLRSYVEALAGGMKITHDHINELRKAELSIAAQAAHQPPPPTPNYTTEADTNALSLQMGMGLTWTINNATLVRLCSIDYQHSWTSRLEGLDYNNGIQVSAGMSFRLGRWGE